MQQHVKQASSTKRAAMRVELLVKMQTQSSRSGATATPLFSSCGCTGAVVKTYLHIAQRCWLQVLAWTSALLQDNQPLQPISSAPRLKSHHLSNKCFRHIWRKLPQHARHCCQSCCMQPLCLHCVVTCTQVGCCSWIDKLPVIYRGCQHCCTNSRNFGLQESPARQPAWRMRSPNRGAWPPVAWTAT